MSKSVLCFTPAMTVEVGKLCTDKILLRNHTPKEISVAMLPVPRSHKFTLVSKPDALTPVPTGGDITLTFEIVLHCTTTVTLDVPLELGEGGTKARITGVVTSAPSYLLDFDEIKVGAKLGDGASASVMKGVSGKILFFPFPPPSRLTHALQSWRGVDVALKCFRLADLDPELRTSYLAEAKLLMGLHHPHVIALYGICEHPQLTMVMEYAPLGALSSVLERQKLDVRIRFRVAADAAKGVGFLHSANVLHRDLKPDNLLLFSLSFDSIVVVKLSDFGASRLVIDSSTKSYTKGIGTPSCEKTQYPPFIDASDNVPSLPKRHGTGSPPGKAVQPSLRRVFILHRPVGAFHGATGVQRHRKHVGYREQRLRWEEASDSSGGPTKDRRVDHNLLGP